ncbi:hypothetical protein PCE1_002529 [Barthelona sp. PCE]
MASRKTIGNIVFYNILHQFDPQSNMNSKVGVGDTKTVFDLTSRPSISLQSYLRRLEDYRVLNGKTSVPLLIFLKRFLKSTDLTLSGRNVHKLVSTALLLAAKIIYDERIPSKSFSSVSGISAEEIDKLEKNFTTGLDFNFYIDRKTYNEEVSSLVESYSKFILNNFKNENCNEHLLTIDEFVSMH